MDIDNGLGLGIFLFFVSIGLCMFTLFICNLNGVKKCCKENTNQINNEYIEV